jgi:cobaltochelatase CobS|tara:strand:- start:4980 stop:6164 length:1185 start_codon:yes stop_codon:yes gene_type:complete
MKNDNVINTINELKAMGKFPVAKTSDVYTAARKNGHSYNSAKSTFLIPSASAGKRGVWNLEAFENGQAPISVPVPAPAPTTNTAFQMSSGSVRSVHSEEVYVPAVNKNFVQWGEYKNIKKIIDSQRFFPVYISGLSGNGKTMMVEQACAKTKREYVRVQISPETDEDDLIGGFRLINGETVFQKGPVIKAMEAGAILLIDEIDRGSNKIMCLQGVLEGNPVLIKKTGETVSPANGFNIIATANTKGQGSDDGRFVAAQVIDEAFLERFVANIEQSFPSSPIESKIVGKHMNSYDVEDSEFITKLVAWSKIIRKTFDDDGVDEVVSTRRLCHIAKAYSIFGNRLTAIKMCISRFETETRDAFLDLYTKIDAGEIDPDAEETPAAELLDKDGPVPF